MENGIILARFFFSHKSYATTLYADVKPPIDNHKDEVLKVWLKQF